jgi:hypothetical protein
MINRTKLCRTCKIVKILTNFQKCAASNDGLAHDCKDCANEYKRNYDKKYPERAKARKNKWNNNHPEQRKNSANDWYHFHKDVARNTSLKRKYGITLEQKRQMAESQNYACALCSFTAKDLHKLHVDHNHSTKQIRSLLCRRCNLLVGIVEKWGLYKFISIYTYLINWRTKELKPPTSNEQRRKNILKSMRC